MKGIHTRIRCAKFLSSRRPAASICSICTSNERYKSMMAKLCRQRRRCQPSFLSCGIRLYAMKTRSWHDINMTINGRDLNAHLGYVFELCAISKCHVHDFLEMIQTTPARDIIESERPGHKRHASQDRKLCNYCLSICAAGPRPYLSINSLNLSQRWWPNKPLLFE